MRRARLIALALALAAGCAKTVPPPPPPTSTIREVPPTAGPRVIAVYQGKASWYGREQQGGPTASGERFNMHALTAAHLKLPMNTHVRVTNLRNGRQVIVRINDRGPYGHRCIIDLSRAAAERLDMLGAGIAPVRLEVLAP
jgi:rare lipoprotein A